MILVSAGHHAPGDPGACFESFCEHAEAMSWARALVAYLRDDGIDAAMVPAGPLKKKVEYINSYLPTLAVEIHFNSAKNAEGRHIGRGCETLYHPKSPAGRIAAQAMHDALAPIFPPGRGAKEGWYRMDKPGHVDYVGDVDGDEKIDYFLAATHCPAVIVEPQFIHLKTHIRVHAMEGCRALAECISSLVHGTHFSKGD